MSLSQKVCTARMIVVQLQAKTQIIQDAPSKTHIMLVNKNIAPSKLPMEVDERGDAFRGIPKLCIFGVLGLSWGFHGHPQA